MCIAQQQEIMDEGVELGDSQIDRVSSLVFARRERASLEIAMLKNNPVSPKVAVEKRVRPDKSLTVQKGMILAT
jgi:hypothetical protein